MVPSQYMPAALISLQKLLYESCNGIKLFIIQFLQILHQHIQFLRLPVVCIKKLAGCDAEILADIEEIAHGWQCFPVFNIVYITCILAQSKTHLSGRNIFCVS